jgi:Cu+-exporting ATPase
MIFKKSRSLSQESRVNSVDGILMSDSTAIDYSFVTGEADSLNNLATRSLLVEDKWENYRNGSLRFTKLLDTTMGNDVFQKMYTKHKTITDTVSSILHLLC